MRTGPVVLCLLLAAAAAPRPCRGWEAKAAKVDRRLKEIASALKSARRTGPGGPILRLARQRRKPGWVRRSYWAETVRGKQYAFGVGIASHIRNQSLLVDMSEQAARAQLARLMGTTERTVDTTTHPASVTETTRATISDSTPIDWYYDAKEGILYTLVVAPPR